MFKPNKIILFGMFLMMTQSVMAKALVVDQMLVDLEQNCQNYEQVYQYQELKSYQHEDLQNGNTVSSYHADLLDPDITPYFPLKLMDQCQKTLINNQLEWVQQEKKLLKGDAREIVRDFEILIYRSLKSLYDERAYSKSDIEQLKGATQQLLNKLDENPDSMAHAYLPIVPLIRLLKYDLHYSPEANHKIFYINQEFNKIFKKIYKNDSLHDDLLFQQILPVFITQFDYSNEAYQLISAIQLNDVERIKSRVKSYSQLYDNQLLADEFHKKYPHIDFDEVIRKEAVAERLTYAFYKLNDMGNVQKWIEQAGLIGTDEVQCTTKTLVADPHLNAFLKQDQAWYQPRFEKQMKACHKIITDTAILSKFDFQKVMDNYQQHCGAMYAEKIPLLRVKNSQLVSDDEFYSMITMISVHADLLSDRSPVKEQCMQAMRANQIEMLEYYVDHLKPTAFSYEDAQNELKNLRK